VTVAPWGEVPSPSADVARRLERVRGRIVAAGGDLGRITVVAVTKGFGPATIDAALGAGLRDLGENYAAELQAKWRGGPRWHFLGTVQRNKVRTLAPFVHLWHGVDRHSAVDEIARRAPGAAVLVQVGLSSGGGRGGCTFAAAPELVERARRAGLDVRGLMAVGPPVGGPEAARPGFSRLAQLRGELALTELSMGMSADLEVAVEEGATIVRPGTALFGPRPERVAARR
jgi:uncharacterized pyridoxal phosphate-containing UPF0001 family protein